MPDGVLRMLAPFSCAVRGSLADIGAVRRASAAKAQTILGWSPRPREQAITATIDSLPHPPSR